jgi:hypothetical protein
MRPWFWRRAAAGPLNGAHEGEAYREGRIDQASRDGGVAAPASRADVRAAYRKGRAEAAPRRRGGIPLLGLIVLLVVVFGALMLYLAAQNGSFAGGGAVIDRDLSSATQPVRRAEDKTGAALQRAGEHLQQNAGSPPSSGSSPSQ